MNTTDLVRISYPDCGIVILGNFNNLDISNLTTSLSLKQIVPRPTRGVTILDLIFTNLHKLYDKPCIICSARLF